MATTLRHADKEVTFAQSQNNRTLMKGSVSSSGIRGGVLGHLEACKSTINDGLHAGVKNTFARVHTYAYCMQLAGLFGPRSRVPTPCQEVSLSSM